MKKYIDFLNEETWVQMQANEYENLKSDIIKILNMYSGSFKNYSFIRNGESKFKDCLKEFKDDGINVDYFMKKYINRVIRDQDFTERGAIADMLLYKYDKSHPLSGNLLTEDIDGWEDTATIKYDYGYHIVELGKKYLFQSYNNLYEFFEQCAKEYGRDFFDNRMPLQIIYDFNRSDVEDYTSYTSKNGIYIMNINFEGMYKNGYIDNLKSLRIDIEKEIGDNTPTFYFDDHNNIVDIIGDLTNTSNTLLQKYKSDYEFYTSIQKYNL